MYDTSTTPGRCIGHWPVSMLSVYGVPGATPEQTNTASGWKLTAGEGDAMTRSSKRILRAIAIAARPTADGMRDFEGLR